MAAVNSSSNASKHFIQNNSNSYNLHIAIDFGTDGLGVAYAFNDLVYIQNKWPSAIYGMITTKPKCIALFNPQQQLQSFGIDAQYQYIQLTSTRKQSWMLFKQFKMALHANNEQKENHHETSMKKQLTATNGLKMDSSTVFIQIFKYIQQNCADWLHRKGLRFNHNEVEWIITVPVIWNDEAKNCMKQWASSAGFEHIRIVYESDCASLAMQYQLNTKEKPRYDYDPSKLEAITPALDISCLNKRGAKSVPITASPSHRRQSKLSPDTVLLYLQSPRLTQTPLKSPLPTSTRKRKSFPFPNCPKSIKVTSPKKSPQSAHLKSPKKARSTMTTPTWSSRRSRSFPAKKLRFRKGDKYILVDAGGGTVDIACHEIIGERDEFGVREILSPCGGPWGSRCIDEKFKSLLNKIFGKEWMQEFKEIFGTKWIELMDNFRNAKETCFKRKDVKYHNVELPMEFVEYLQQKCDDERKLEQMVKKTKLTGKKQVMLDDGYLRLNMATWKYMFDYVLTDILKQIHGLLTKEVMEDCKYLCLVGGLSASPYVQQRCEEEFGDDTDYGLDIVTAKEPILTVVAGAAYFGITRNYIQARILRKTYGVRVNMSLSMAVKYGIPDAHIKDNMVYDGKKQRCHIRNCFDVIARKGDEVLTNQVVITKSKRLRFDQKFVMKYIVCSDKLEPKVIGDGKILGELKVDFGGDMKHKVILTEFHFYDTMLKVFVYPNKLPDKRKEVELSYHQ